MKKIILLLALAFSVPTLIVPLLASDAPSGGSGSGSGNSKSVVVPAPTPTPTPAPVPTITMPDGKAYTAAEIEKAVRELQQRIQELTTERNNYLGQIVDLTNQLQQKQAQPLAK